MSRLIDPLAKIVGVDTGKVYSTNEIGLEHFEHVQTRLDQLWSLVKDRSAEASILPYAQSTWWWLPGHGVAKADCGEIRARTCDNVEEHPEKKAFGR